MISHALRHEPAAYGLQLDAYGWVGLDELVHSLRSRPGYTELIQADVSDMVARASKKRVEIRDGDIRAIYGHSVPDRIERDAADPPVLLFHGTSPAAAEAIEREGLQPMQRQYVHLSADIETAQSVGARKAGQPVILRIDATSASAAGVAFYLGGEQTWLADAVPPPFIEFRPPSTAHPGS